MAGGVAETASSMVLDSFFEDAEGKAKDNAGPVMGELWESGVEKNSEYTEQAVEAAAKAHGSDSGVDDPDAIEKLLVAYTKAVEGSAACG